VPDPVSCAGPAPTQNPIWEPDKGRSPPGPRPLFLATRTLGGSEAVSLDGQLVPPYSGSLLLFTCEGDLRF
jgi:hypothetical protein